MGFLDNDMPTPVLPELSREANRAIDTVADDAMGNPQLSGVNPFETVRSFERDDNVLNAGVSPGLNDAIQGRIRNRLRPMLNQMQGQEERQVNNQKFQQRIDALSALRGREKFNYEIYLAKMKNHQDRAAARAQVIGTIFGAAGAIGGAVAGGPAGATGGYYVGSGIGQSLGSK